MNGIDSSEKKPLFTKLTFFIVCLYLFRLVYCYLSYFKNYQWLVPSTDESHIYLSGLKFYITHEFPDWGPDIIYSSTYLVGGMQGLLVGLPLFIWPHPFAPFLFLYLCLSTGLVYLSWYITKLFPSVHRWLIYCLVALSTFTINTGLRVINPAYALCFAIPFILSYIETLDIFDKKFIHPNWRFFWMGLGMLGVFQLHASYVFLVILWMTSIAYLWFKERKIGPLIKPLIFTGLGLFVAFLPLAHVLYHYGTGVFSQQGKSLEFKWRNAGDITKIIFYFIAQCGFETSGYDTAYQWDSVRQNAKWPGDIIFWVVQLSSYVLFVSEVLFLLWKKWWSYIHKYRKFLVMIGGIIILLFLSYIFSTVRPKPHTNMILLPLSAIYLFWFLNNLFATTKIKYWYFGVFVTFLVGFYILVVLMTANFPDHGYREKAFEAIQKKDASIFETVRFARPIRIR